MGTSLTLLNLNAIMTIAYRDILKFVRDPQRLIAAFIFPALFIGILARSFQASLGGKLGFDIVTFTFVGVLMQTLFQSTATGIISLLEDRDNDFSQEIFISPISRFAIIFGKIAGESVVAMVQGLAVLLFGIILRVPLSFGQIVSLIPAGVIVCLLGGAFGVILLSLFNSQRSANQIFPLLFFPQFFLAGVFNPIGQLDPVLNVISHIAPLRYAVDLGRDAYYAGKPEYHLTVQQPVGVNLLIISLMFTVFLLIGTTLFVRNERNK